MPAVGDKKQTEFERLCREVRACRMCVEAPLGPPLPHEPRPLFQMSPSARICIAGQAPGVRAHDAGVTFRDPSGDRLRDWLGLSNEEFYDATRLAIVPMGFCFPGLDEKGGDRPPRRECAPNWRTLVFAQLPALELIFLIGQYAQSWHLGDRRKKTLTATVAAWRSYLDDPAPGPRVLVLPHPSWRNSGWLKRNPWFAAEVLPEVRRRVRTII